MVWKGLLGSIGSLVRMAGFLVLCLLFAKLGGDAVSHVNAERYQHGEEVHRLFMVAVRDVDSGLPGSVTLQQWRREGRKWPLLEESAESPDCAGDIENCTRLEIGSDGVYRVKAGVPFVPLVYSEYRVTPQGEVVPLYFRQASFLYNLAALVLFLAVWFAVVRPLCKRRLRRRLENLAAAGKAR